MLLLYKVCFLFDKARETHFVLSLSIEGEVFIQIVNDIILYVFMIRIAYYDIKERKIHNSILIFMILVYISLFLISSLFFNLKIPIKDNFIAAFGAFLLFIFMKIAHPSGVGMGDVKLVFVLGLYLGYSVFEVIGISLIFLSIYRFLRKEISQEGFPYAPFLLAAMLFKKFMICYIAIS
ncbi:MAG: prepilin peptidase [Lachnospiraceae bacterium]|nr:prepilin peptidase [Lachnospiraceae bacterium]